MALIIILAQMGCYVPASEATIPIRDRICTRFGTSDDMEENASSFAVEMTETAFILETCTSRSLVLIDELGRGTANDEGAAIAWSISEEMIQRGSYTCFATHYHQLNRLAQLYPRCRCYHMGTESNVVRYAAAIQENRLADHLLCTFMPEFRSLSLRTEGWTLSIHWNVRNQDCSAEWVASRSYP